MAVVKGQNTMLTIKILAALTHYQSEVEITFIKKFGREPTKDDRGTHRIQVPHPRYIGECFLKIANHLSFKPNLLTTCSKRT